MIFFGKIFGAPRQQAVPVHETLLGRCHTTEETSAVTYSYYDEHRFTLMFARGKFSGRVAGTAAELLAKNQRIVTLRHLLRAGVPDLIKLLERIAQGKRVAPEEILRLSRCLAKSAPTDVAQPLN